MTKRIYTPEQLAKKRQSSREWMRKNRIQRAEVLTEYYKNNKDAYRNRHYKSRYGATLEVYEDLYKNQKGLCAICGHPETSCSQRGTVRRLSLDHCHTTGRLRGLLCSNCNKGIGNLQDSVEILTKAIEYLREGNK